MTAIFSGIVPTTELEAVNAMLSAIGEAPITTLSPLPTAPDVVMAINLLRNQCREVCTMGWRFNMEWGYEIPPAVTNTVTSRDGTSINAATFIPPAQLARFRVSACQGQIGSQTLDLVVRKPRTLDPAAYPLVFYDRTNNRDGIDSSIWPYLYIDPVWFMDFDSMPDTARRYIVVRAGRQFAQQTVGSAELAGFAKEDEVFALRTLKRYEGQEDDQCNMFDHMMDTAAFLGNRTRYLSGVVDNRNTKGPTPLASISISQNQSNFSYNMNTAVQFTAVGTDTDYNTVAITPVWSVDVGTISGTGVWHSPSDGFYGAATITASAGGITQQRALAYAQ